MDTAKRQVLRVFPLIALMDCAIDLPKGGGVGVLGGGEVTAPATRRVFGPPRRPPPRPTPTSKMANIIRLLNILSRVATTSCLKENNVLDHDRFPESDPPGAAVLATRSEEYEQDDMHNAIGPT